MELKGIYLYEGRNIYSHKPVAKAIIDLGEYENIPTKDIPGFNDRLIKMLPGLKNHGCCYGFPGGFIKRLINGTYLAHVIEHCALEIQAILGHDVAFGKARQLKDSEYYVVVECKSIFAGEESLKLAYRLVNSLIKGKTPNLKKALEIAEKNIGEKELGPSTKAIVDEAKKRGIPYFRLNDRSLIQLGLGKYQKRIEATISENTKCIGVDIACDKESTKKILSLGGVPVPEGGVVYSVTEALELAKKIGYPVVIKPCDGNQGRGVSLNLKNEKEVIEAFKVAECYSSRIIVEKYIKGRHYRVLVVNGKMTAASERIPAHVVGDGKHNIKELIDIINSDPLRGEKHEKPLTKIKVDPVVHVVLKRQRLTLDYVPSRGEKVFLRQNGNLSTGGTAVDVTDEIHEENRFLAERAAKLLKLDIAGVDITTQHISKPVSQSEGAVIEVNAAPGIRMHLFPTRGKPRNVAKAIVDMLFPENARHSIPIIAVTGTNGKTTTTRIIGHVLDKCGYSVGMATTDGIFVKGRCIMKGDNSGPLSARTVLMDPEVDVAVLETARGGIIRGGLGYNLSDVGIITNISEDHIGQDGIETLDELFMVKSLVIEAVKDNGWSILNADDHMVVKMAQRAKGKIIYFGSEENNIIIKKHIMEEGNRAVHTKNGWIVLSEGGYSETLVHVKDLPITLKGVAKHNIQNALAAIACLWALGVYKEKIVEGLKTFYCDEIHNPGRMNIKKIRDFQVMIDYGHNVSGFKSIINTARQIKKGRLVGVIASPGDRSDDSIFRLGKVAGKGFDRIIIKEDCDLRGRQRGEVAELIRQGAIAGGMKKENIEIIYSEKEAVVKAIAQGKTNDLIVVFYEKYDKIKEAMEEGIRKLENREDSKNIAVRDTAG